MLYQPNQLGQHYELVKYLSQYHIFAKKNINNMADEGVSEE